MLVRCLHRTTIAAGEFAARLPKSRFSPYGRLRVPNVGDYVFEYNRKRFYQAKKNPGVGKYVGKIKDASSRNSECFVLFADKVVGEWVEIKNLRKAPSPGYVLFADNLQVKRRTKYILAEYPPSGGVTLDYSEETKKTAKKTATAAKTTKKPATTAATIDVTAPAATAPAATEKPATTDAKKKKKL